MRCKGLTNAQVMAINLTNLGDSAGNYRSSISASMALLVGENGLADFAWRITADIGPICRRNPIQNKHRLTMQKHSLFGSTFVLAALVAILLAWSSVASTLSNQSTPFSKANQTMIASMPAGHWEIVSSPNPSTADDNPLYGVGCANTTDCWAVGYELSTTRGYETLIEHYNGSDWSLISSPNTGSTRVLNSVVCNNATDCWAVGGFTDTMNNFQNAPLIEHNTGNGWNVVSGQLATGSSDSYLNSISCLGRTDCWAVGSQTLEGVGQQQPLMEHFDGTSWTVATSVNPNPGLWNVLTGVSCASSNDCWTVGYYSNGNVYQSQIEHYDGTRWTIVAGPAFIPTQQNVLNSVFCNAANDCWAVGYDISTTTHVFETLIEHYDGNAWAVVTNPHIALSNELIGLTCMSANDCWAVGNQDNGTVYQTLIEHYDGNEWTIFTSDNTSANESNVLNNVNCVNANQCWAVGSCNRDGFSQTLVEHYTVPAPLTGVVSRKVHGSAGTFDIDLPPVGNPGIECRSGGDNGDYTLVFTFATPLTTVASVGASATGSGSAPGATGIIDSTDAHHYIVNLSNVPNAQYTTVSLTNVTDSVGNFSAGVQATMGVLLGDVNGDGQVDSSDLILVKQQTLQPVNDNTGTSNFREDVNTDGNIDSGDLLITKRQTLTGLP
jgi:Dockerin type I domain